MTCGIYLLRFTGTNKVYIGQSVDIEYRYKKHIQNLKNGKHNYKMLDAYSRYGLPELEILLDDLSEQELSENEKLAFSIFDSVNSGLNVASEPSISEVGELNPVSKYSNSDIEKVFFMLLDKSTLFSQIECFTGVSISTIRHIANLEAHSWLKDKYPNEYKILADIKTTKSRQVGKNTAKHRGIEYPALLSPEGVEYNVTNIAEFCRQHNLDSSSIAKVLKKRPKYISHKGWKLK